MKILFKEYLNKLIHKRNNRENFLFFGAIIIIYNILILKYSTLIKAISSFLNTSVLVFVYSLFITTLLNLRSYSTYLNPFIRNALEIKTKTAFAFHYLKLLFFQLIFVGVIIFQVRYSLKTSYILFLFLLINPLLITISMKNIKTLVIFSLSNVAFLILFISNINQWYFCIIFLVIVVFNILVFKKSISKEKSGENKIFWLPKQLFFETLILTIRKSKLKQWLIVTLILSMIYFIFPYNNQFDIFEWLSNQTDFKNTSPVHIPVLFIFLMLITYIIQFKVFTTTFDKDKKYIQSNHFIMLHKFLIVFLLIIFTYIIQYLITLHMDSINIKQLFEVYSKTQNIKGWGMSILFISSFILSLLSVITVDLNKTIKFFIFCFVIYCQFNDTVIWIINYDSYSIISLLLFIITITVMSKYLSKKEKNEMYT